MATHQAGSVNADAPEPATDAPLAASVGPAGARLVISAGGQVAADVPCARCRYNLVTLAASTKCPECGQPVSDSLRAYLSRLCFAPLRWVTGLRDGLILMVGGLVLAVVGAVVLQNIIAALIGPTITGTGVASPRVLRVFAWISAAVGAVLYIPLLAGAWVLTAPEPGSRSPQMARRTARVCLWLLVGCYALGLVALGLASWSAGASDTAGAPEVALLEFYHRLSGNTPMTVLGIVQTSIFAVGALALLGHLRTLLARVPRPRLAGFARVLAVGGVIVLVPLLVVMLVQLFVLDWVLAGTPPAAGPGAATWVNTSTGRTTVVVTGASRPLPAARPPTAGTQPAGWDQAATIPPPEPAVTAAEVVNEASLDSPGATDDEPAATGLRDADTTATATPAAPGAAIPALPVPPTQFFVFAILAGATGCLFLAYGAAAVAFACLAIRAFSAAVREARHVDAALQAAQASSPLIAPAADGPANAPP